MLGERGLWYKMTFFERSVRVPLIVHAPRLLGGRRVTWNVSLVDLLPTLVELAGGPLDPVVPLDGRSLLGSSSDTVYAEYMAEGTSEPVFMIRRGNRKYIACASDPPQLFDLAADPHELDNLAGRPELTAAFAQEAGAKWDSAVLRRQVIDSQRQRVFIQETLLKGRIQPWDWQPRTDAARQYNRNYSSELYDTDRRARIPNRPEPSKTGRA